MNKYHIQGALVTISLISWGILLWTHFDDAHSVLILPAVFGLILVLMIFLLF